jgi:hypothetical protein
MSPLRLALSALVLVLGLASLLLVALDVASPVRAPITLTFSLLGPGWAIVQPLRLQDPLQELVLAVAVSMALVGVVAGASVYLGRWSPGLVLAILVVITGIALSANPLRLLAARTEPQPDTDQEART